jgi:uncharacterized protein
MKAQLSIHDVAPETLPQVADMLARLQVCGPLMLLVIPGKAWSAEDLAQLRQWAGQGHMLAGHGWSHHVDHRRSLYHKIHGQLISRFVAEHLSLTPSEILDLMRRCYAWFEANDLPAPTHYVPPAWGLGNVTLAQLRDQPFASVETLGGVCYPAENLFCKLPLLGYEADTPLRAWFLKKFNIWNRRNAMQGPLIRLALHPYDFRFRLADEMLLDCRRYRCQASFS